MKLWGIRVAKNTKIIGKHRRCDKAVVKDRRAYVLANNQSEGNTLLTVQAIKDHIFLKEGRMENG